jgi:DNA-binding NtrC family response regulator
MMSKVKGRLNRAPRAVHTDNPAVLDSRSLFPQRSIKILVVDDEFALVDLHLEHLTSYELYDVTCAYNATTADKILSSSKRFHVCMMDLGLYDMNNDEYFLIKKYSPRISFIICPNDQFMIPRI